MFSFRRRVMRALRVLIYLGVVCAVLGGAAGFVVMAFQPPTVTLASLQEAPKVAPGVQASRNAVPVEKTKTAALGATDQAAVDDVTPQATQNEGSQARAHRASERSNREVRRRSDGYTRDARWSSSMPRLHGPE
jgi:hypothetical protein